MTYTYADTPTTGPYLNEHTLEVPTGFTVGTIVTRPGRNYRYVTRNRDSVSMLCPVTPAADEVLPITEMRAALHKACDDAKG